MRTYPLADHIAAERADRHARGRPLKDDWLPLRHIFHVPEHLAIFEQTRIEVANRGEDLGLRIPYDAVFWIREKSTGPVSRLGGLPFRSPSRPWPRNRDGSPAMFIAQFCLVDSLDVIRPKPRRDVLHLFARDCYVKDNFVGALEFFMEWSHIGTDEMSNPNDVPAGGILPFCRTGVLCRAADHPLFDPQSIPENDRWRLQSTQSSRIGGFPRWIQDPPSEGRLLVTCALNHHKSRGKSADAADDADLCLGDAGCVFVTTHPILRWRYRVTEQDH
jgi:hypothetical protein